jgi:hypothetical protein
MRKRIAKLAARAIGRGWSGGGEIADGVECTTVATKGRGEGKDGGSAR